MEDHSEIETFGRRILNPEFRIQKKVRSQESGKIPEALFRRK